MKNNLLIISVLLFSLFLGCKPKHDKIIGQNRTVTTPPAVVEAVRGQSDQAPIQRKAQPKEIKKSPFTASIRQQISEAKADIRRIQYFISKDITINKSTDVNRIKIDEEGNVVMVDGKQETEFFIPSDLKGAFKDSTENQLMITFSVSEERYLTFEKSDKDNGIYYLIADWHEKGYGSINYGGEPFTILPGGKGAQLLFSLNRISENKTDVVKEKGRDINNNDKQD